MLLRLKERDIHMEYEGIVALAGRHLQEGNAEAFSHDVKELMGWEYQEVRMFLEHMGAPQ